MADLKHNALVFFAQANGLEAKPDFARRTKTYRWDGKQLTPEELMQTPSFQGFLDGYCGNRDRYDSGAPKGALRPQQANLEGRLQLGTVEGIPIVLEPTTQEVTKQLSGMVQDSPQTHYRAQYVKGAAYRGRLPR